MVSRYEVPGLEMYTGKPCVYVRWIEKGDKYYVGRTQNLYQRYSQQYLNEIIYFEEYDTLDETIEREPILIQEFLQCGLPLLNVGKSGRRYTYERIKKIVISRYVHRKYPPGMSERLQRWYEEAYFTKPNKKRGIGNSRSYQRGREWIAEYERSIT